MGNYTSFARLNSRFGEYTVNAAATLRGSSSITTADEGRVEDAITQVEAKADGIIAGAGIAVPVTDPRAPANLREIVERMALNQLRFNSAGGKRSEAEAQEYANQIAELNLFADGTEVLDGQAQAVVDYILTNNDDGRGADWGEYKRDTDGNIVNAGTMRPNLEKIL